MRSMKMLPFNLNVLAVAEEERLERIRSENLERRVMRDNSDCFAINDIRFKELFRVNKDLAQFILNGIIVDIQNDNIVAVPPAVKFFTALHFYATGTYQRIIGQSYNISTSQQTISKILHEVTAAIIRNFSEEWVTFPRTADRKNAIKEKFMQLNRFPGTIGAVDCTHVEMTKPHEEEHTYLNRKGYHSKNIQIVCDSDLRILNMNATYGGATHDSFIWRNSGVCQELEACFRRGDTNSWLIGDSGYPQQPWLMTPIENANPGTPEYRYTQCHIQARNCVERCIGVLKGRFLCLSKVLRYSPRKCGNIANACAILHNMCCEARLNEDFHAPGHNNPGNIPYDGIHGPQLVEGELARRNVIQLYFH